MTNFTQKSAPRFKEYYLRGDQAQMIHAFAVIHEVQIAAEATNPNTGETGIVIAFPDDDAMKLFQNYLKHEFHATTVDLDRGEVGDYAN